MHLLSFIFFSFCFVAHIHVGLFCLGWEMWLMWTFFFNYSSLDLVLIKDQLTYYHITTLPKAVNYMCEITSTWTCISFTTLLPLHKRVDQLSTLLPLLLPVLLLSLLLLSYLWCYYYFYLAAIASYLWWCCCYFSAATASYLWLCSLFLFLFFFIFYYFFKFIKV